VRDSTCGHMSAYCLASPSATGIIVGALAAGDSVRGSLRQIALQRLGATEYALASGDRFFRAKLADELSVAPVLQFRGIGVNTEGSARANNIQILGVDERFWRLGSKTGFDSGPDDAVVNLALATKLGVKPAMCCWCGIEKPQRASSRCAAGVGSKCHRRDETDGQSNRLRCGLGAVQP